MIAAILPTRGASSSSVYIIDFSHLHHVPTSSRKSALEEHANNGSENIVINLSHSSIGDDSIKEILSGVLLERRLTHVHMDLSMNRLTPVGVKWLFQTILDSAHPKETTGNQTAIPSSSTLPPTITSLDLGWNYLAADVAETINFYTSLEKLVANRQACPTKLCFDQCSLGPAFCRALGKGLMLRYFDEEEEESETTTSTTTNTPKKGYDSARIPAISFSLCGNTEIGDAGTAAIAAALRTITSTSSEDENGSPQDNNTMTIVLEKLDLSSCGMGNFGCEALALAIEDGCVVDTLDLSNNQIKDEGIAALGRAIALADRPTVRVLDLSNNEIGVNGCTALLVAIGKGHLREVRLRSCHIHAEAAEIIGKGLQIISLQRSIPELHIDLSGNPFGVLRGKTKKNGGKYSASRLRSTATATAASYVKFFKKGLKDVGMDTMLGGKTAESDDEEEEKLGIADNSDDKESSSEFAKKRCGAKSMVNAFLKDNKASDKSNITSERCKIKLGLRHCFFDHGAADALAAMVVEANDRFSTDISLDVGMNPVLEEEMVDALEGNDQDDDRLHEMAERHLDILASLKEAQERAAEARSMARARSQAMWDQSNLPVSEDEDEYHDSMFGSDEEVDDSIDDEYDDDSEFS